jgi:hypothetical protein
MITEPTTYQPEIWAVKKDDIYAAITAIESGICYAQECLATHDQSLGRTTRKNKSSAERMESDLRQMSLAHAALRLLPNDQAHPQPGAAVVDRKGIHE